MIEPSDEFARRQKHYAKKHPRELQAALLNLQTYLDSLNAGVAPLQVKAGFIHPESNGVIAIDQKGGGKALAQTRLYVYAETEAQTVHIITLGDKQTQKDDLRTCRNYVESLRKARELAESRQTGVMEPSATDEEEVRERRGDAECDGG